MTSLRSLIQAREGVSWTLGLSGNVVAMVTKYTNDLFENGLVKKIINLLKGMDIDKELNKLMEGQAIKDTKHKQQIVNLINETTQALGECLFYWACQSPLPKDSLLMILSELKKAPVLSEGYQPLDFVHLSLFFSLIVSFKAGDSSQDVGGALDGSFTDERYPFQSDPDSLLALHNEIKKDDRSWSNKGLEAAVRFAWAILLRECSTLEAFKGILFEYLVVSYLLIDYGVLEEDETLIDKSITSDAFQFLRQSIVKSSQFLKEVTPFHIVITILTHTGVLY